MKLFAILQALDVGTTLIGLRLGLCEMSPAVKFFMGAGPVAGLLLAKAVAFGLVGLALALRRPRAVRLANFWYTLVICWNAGILIRVLA